MSNYPPVIVRLPNTSTTKLQLKKIINPQADHSYSPWQAGYRSLLFCEWNHWRSKPKTSNLVFIFSHAIHQKWSVRRCVCGLKSEWYLATFSGFARWEESRLKYFTACMSASFPTKNIAFWWSQASWHIWRCVVPKCRDAMTSYKPYRISTIPSVVGWSCWKVEGLWPRDCNIPFQNKSVWIWRALPKPLYSVPLYLCHSGPKWWSVINAHLPDCPHLPLIVSSALHREGFKLWENIFPNVDLRAWVLPHQLEYCAVKSDFQANILALLPENRAEWTLGSFPTKKADKHLSGFRTVTNERQI